MQSLLTFSCEECVFFFVGVCVGGCVCEYSHIPANFSFLKGVTPLSEFLKYKKRSNSFFENFDDVLSITKVHIFVE